MTTVPRLLILIQVTASHWEFNSVKETIWFKLFSNFELFDRKRFNELAEGSFDLDIGAGKYNISLPAKNEI